jgi:hypothetical protein
MHARTRKPKPILRQPLRKTRISKQPPPAVNAEWVGARQAAAVFGISPWAVRDLVRRELVDGKRWGRRVLANYASLRRYMERLPNAASSRPIAE